MDFGVESCMAVSLTIPGAIALTLVVGANDFASDLVREIIAPFVAPYRGSDEPRWAAIEAITITCEPRVR